MPLWLRLELFLFSDIRAASAQVDEASAQLRQCSILSPVSGILLRRLVSVGESVNQLAPKTAFLITDRSITRVRAEIDEADISLIRLGQHVDVSIGSSKEPTYRGAVVSISPVMGRRNIKSTDPAEKADRDILEAIVSLDDKSNKLPIGLRVTARFVGNRGATLSNTR